MKDRHEIRDLDSRLTHAEKHTCSDTSIKVYVLLGHKWRISAPGIGINNPKIIDLFSHKFYGGPHKIGFGIVNCNLRRT